MSNARPAKYTLESSRAQRVFPFRGVVFDIDPGVQAKPRECYEGHSRPRSVRTRTSHYITVRRERGDEYISLRVGAEPCCPIPAEPIRHPQVAEVLDRDDEGALRPRNTDAEVI